MIESLSGPAELPSPLISVVMPWKILDGTLGATSSVSSDWPSMSMKPGATTWPAASMDCRAATLSSRPIAAIRPPRMPMSPAYQGEPVPSMMWPWWMTTSRESVWALRAGGMRQTSSRAIAQISRMDSPLFR